MRVLDLVGERWRVGDGVGLFTGLSARSAFVVVCTGDDSRSMADLMLYSQHLCQPPIDETGHNSYRVRSVSN